MVKLVTFDSAYECYMAWPIILISPYLFPLSLWIQITIHPLSTCTDGAIVILVFQAINFCQFAGYICKTMPFIFRFINNVNILASPIAPWIPSQFHILFESHIAFRFTGLH